jgi:hypothetical protein
MAELDIVRRIRTSWSSSDGPLVSARMGRMAREHVQAAELLVARSKAAGLDPGFDTEPPPLDSGVVYERSMLRRLIDVQHATLALAVAYQNAAKEPDLDEGFRWSIATRLLPMVHEHVVMLDEIVERVT